MRRRGGGAVQSLGHVTMIGCIHDDRPTSIVGIKLAVLSFSRFWPGFDLIVSCPSAPSAFRQWLQNFPNVTLWSDTHLEPRGWDAKAAILGLCLDAGHSDVVWIDSDVVATAGPPRALCDPDPAVLVLAEEARWEDHDGAQRTRAWGLPVGRSLPTANTCVMRVTNEHRDLLAAWQHLLSDHRYTEAQRQAWYERPQHLMGDQEVLTALLCSTEFADVPMDMLHRGVDIAQCKGPSGCSSRERLRSLRSGQAPPLVHAQGGRPWHDHGDGRPQTANVVAIRSRRYWEDLHRQLSPYTAIARGYAGEVGENTEWTMARSWPARLLSTGLSSYPMLQELPVTLVDEFARHTRRPRRTDSTEPGL